MLSKAQKIFGTFCIANRRPQAVASRSYMLTRRNFLRGATAAAAGLTLVPRHVLGGPRFVPPSEKVNVAIVGVGGQGRTNVRALFAEPSAQIIAVADPVDSVSLDEFYYKGLGARKPVKAEIEKHYAAKTPNYRCAEYEDFRVMMEKEKAIDAILCATPDHLHAYVSLYAMRAGKHIYCEKPLTHNIREARLVAKVAKETCVSTQMGNTGTSNDTIRQTCEWIWDGAIGTVREVHAWVKTFRWNPTLAAPPSDTPPVPPGVNWDLWLGPRQFRPYHPAYVPVKWRDFWDFGGGGMGDFGCHDMNAACWALDLHDPLTVEARTAGNTDPAMAPHGSTIYYQFGPRGNRPAVKMFWYDGGLGPARPEGFPDDEPFPKRSVLFVGDKGVMLCGGAGGKPRLLPDSRMDSYQRPAPKIPRVKTHHGNWLDGCKGAVVPCSNFEYAARLTEITLLGLVAIRTGKKLQWDAPNLKVTNAPEADVILQGQYRPGWEVV